MVGGGNPGGVAGGMGTTATPRRQHPKPVSRVQRGNLGHGCARCNSNCITGRADRAFLFPDRRDHTAIMPRIATTYPSTTPDTRWHAAPVSRSPAARRPSPTRLHGKYWGAGGAADVPSVLTMRSPCTLAQDLCRSAPRLTALAIRTLRHRPVVRLGSSPGTIARDCVRCRGTESVPTLPRVHRSQPREHEADGMVPPSRGCRCARKGAAWSGS